MKPESVFRLRVTKFLKTLPHTAFFPIQQMAISGTPDFLLCIRGQFVALELKSEKGGLSALQKYNLDLIAKHGGKVIVSFPSTWEVDKELLLSYTKGWMDD